MRTPDAPTGCPAPIRPPLGLMGMRPSRSIAQSSIARQLSPGGVMPKWSIAIYSVMVKQSCVSMPSSDATQVRTAEGVGNGRAYGGEDVGQAATSRELVFEQHRRGVVTPAQDTRQARLVHSTAARVVGGVA